MDVVVIKYNAGNTKSLCFALEKLGVQPCVTDDPETILAADKVIFPGQGEASSAMAYLTSTNLDKVLLSLKQPFLGICLGMQLMCTYSDENNTKCLGIIPSQVKKFENNVKVPHMGWNDIDEAKTKLFDKIENNSYLYFVHSYFVEKNQYTIAECTYGLSFSAAIQYKNYYAIQPHPEKSGKAGFQLLSNFLQIV